MSVAPITPKEAQRKHLADTIPSEVYESINEILAERFSEYPITIYQDEVISRVTQKMQSGGTSISTEDFFKYHWLDFEPAYEGSGWRVSFFKPSYGDSFKAHWIFCAESE